MKQTNFFSAFLSALLMSTHLVGCSSHMDHRGKAIEEKQIKQLKTGVHSKDDVIRELGSPSSYDNFDQNTWFYIARLTETTSFWDPKLLDHKTLMITFDRHDMVKDVKIIKEKQQEITPVSRETPYIEADRSFLEQIFGSFSRFGRREEARK